MRAHGDVSEERSRASRAPICDGMCKFGPVRACDRRRPTRTEGWTEGESCTDPFRRVVRLSRLVVWLTHERAAVFLRRTIILA